MRSSKPSKNDQIDTKLLPDAKIGPVPRGTQFSQIPMLQCAFGQMDKFVSKCLAFQKYLNLT